MSLIKSRRICRNPWRHVADDQPPGDGPVTVTLSRWLAEGDTLRGRSDRGVRLAPGDDVAELAGELATLPVVALDFSAFADGRAYSQAHLLRQRYGYTGELRALGVRRDHAAFMERCGIDALELADGEDPDAVLAALDAISVKYQPATDGVAWIFRRRDALDPISATAAGEGEAVK